MRALKAAAFVTELSPKSNDNTVRLHCDAKHIDFVVAPCMSSAWQCEQVILVLQAIIDKAYERGIRDAKA